MKRDMDLIRAILIVIEDDPQYDGLHFLAPDSSADFGLPDYAFEQLGYHLRLLFEAGFVEGAAGDLNMYVPYISKLSWRGHELLDQIRDPEIWRETKEGARKAGGFSLDLLGALAKGLIKKKVQDHTGIDLDL